MSLGILHMELSMWVKEGNSGISGVREKTSIRMKLETTKVMEPERTVLATALMVVPEGTARNYPRYGNSVCTGHGVGKSSYLVQSTAAEA